MTLQIIAAIAQIIGVSSIGWLASRLGYIVEEDIRRWSRFLVDFLFPLLVFNSVMRGFQPERIHELWVLPFLGLGIVAFGAVLGILLRTAVRSTDPDVRKTFHHFCASNNYGFLPIVIVNALWGSTGLANLFLLNMGSSIGYWTIGVGLLSGSRLAANARHILSPTLVGLLLAIVLCLSGLHTHVPGIVLRVAEAGGAAAVPSMLVLTGASLFPLPKLKYAADLALLTGIRLLFLPAAMVVLLILLPLSPDVRNVAIIVALMPVPVSTVVLTRRYGGSTVFAAQAALVTTLVAIVTVPAAVALIALWITF